MTSVYPPYLSSTFITVPPDTLGKIIIAPLASDYCTGPLRILPHLFKVNARSGRRPLLRSPGHHLARHLLRPGGFGSLTITDLSLAAAPEPSSLALLGTGVLGVAETLRRRRQA